METIIFIITVIGGIAGIYTIMDYRKNHVEKPNEEKEHLRLQFNITRELSIDVKNRLIEYADKFYTYDEVLFPGVTIKQYIALLEDSQNTNLSQSLIDDTINLPLTSSIIQSMVQSLQEQYNSLLVIQGLMKAKMLN